MRQLDTCDFCADAADGVYEVVPASVAGESRRLALCADCRATLQSVVDPLLDAADTSPDATPDAAPETTERADEGAETSAAEPAAPSPTVDDGVVIESGSPAEQEAPETEAVDDDSGAGSTEPKRRPSGYAQVIRLLQNRDGAMPRDDLRALATNAYDLGGREFEEAVEAAVENGDVEESPAGLRTT